MKRLCAKTNRFGPTVVLSPFVRKLSLEEVRKKVCLKADLRRVESGRVRIYPVGDGVTLGDGVSTKSPYKK